MLGLGSMALARLNGTRTLRCALRELLSRPAAMTVIPAGIDRHGEQCRGFKTSSPHAAMEDMLKQIASKGQHRQAAVGHLIGVDGSKPYELINKHSEYTENFMLKPLDRKLKRKQIWIELTKAWQTKTPIDGSILNVVRGGYAVSVGGFIAFMPRSMRKTANLHSKFYIINMKSDNSNLVVGEADGNAMTWSKLFRFYKRSLQRLNMIVWIKGTVVALAKDGYCVAMAGHIAFLPKAYRRSRKLESTFRIMAMYPRTGKIIVQEVNAKYFASLSASQSQEDKTNEEEGVEQVEEGVEQVEEGVEQVEEGVEQEDSPSS